MDIRGMGYWKKNRKCWIKYHPLFLLDVLTPILCGFYDIFLVFLVFNGLVFYDIFLVIYNTPPSRNHCPIGTLVRVNTGPLEGETGVVEHLSRNFWCVVRLNSTKFNHNFRQTHLTNISVAQPCTSGEWEKKALESVLTKL